MSAAELDRDCGAAVVPDDAHAAGGSSDAFGAVEAVVSLLVAASPNDRARSVDAPTLFSNAGSIPASSRYFALRALRLMRSLALCKLRRLLSATLIVDDVSSNRNLSAGGRLDSLTQKLQ
ncbi:hypothetical protein VTP01DRAFT_4071 [Rhizomucor pusillus]|uniref:uncharacterized protein n=1 Tax=Rhizomucor pusillus TaxID=4840 RepID=UPI00374275C5